MRGTGAQNICESENNKNNKTIRNIQVQKGNPNGEVRARVYHNLAQGYVSEFGVQCLEFGVLHVASFSQVLQELCEWSGFGT